MSSIPSTPLSSRAAPATSARAAAALMLTFAASAGAGDAIRGRQLYETRCIACHSMEVHRVGPAHRGVFGSRAGTAPEYDYSVALKTSSIVWTASNLDRWLADPEGLVPGQKMGYAVAQAADRADLIAYLMSESAMNKGEQR